MMPQGRRDPKSRALIAAGVLIAAVLVRSWFFLRFDESYFDSDQAIVGLMAKHLVEGRAFPLFFYGQEYMLAVESWLMAPIFVVLGPSVFALRLTLVLINIVTALTLWWLLVKEGRMHPGLAALAAAPFALAPFVASAHLVEAQGGNVEPFLWILIAWVVRSRPLALGAVLAVAFLHREFTIYAVPALLLVQVLRARGRLVPLVRPWAVTVFAFVVVLQAINAVKPYADLFGPGTAGAVSPTNIADNVSGLIERIDVDGPALPGRFRTLAGEYLPLLVGLAGFRPTLLGVGTYAHVGWPELLLIAVVAGSGLMVWLLADLWRGRRFDGITFPLYLGIVGVEAAVAYAVTRDLSVFTFRYGLLALFLPVALAGLTMQAARPIALRVASAALFGLLAAAALVDHLGVIQLASVEPPPGRLSPLAAKLEARRVRIARAGYWRAYALTFLTGERVKVASTELVRVREYQRLADEAGRDVVIIQETPCMGRTTVDEVDGWHLCQ